MKIITDQRCTEYVHAGHPESPDRVSRCVERLREQKELAIEWVEPAAVSEIQLLRAHDPEFLSAVKLARSDFDADTPTYPGIFDHALRAVGGALRGLAFARQGEASFSLLRPPGHHATRNQAMGFCYLNSIAIAALEAAVTGTSKVAVFDFDVHHGNGTETILLDNSRFAYFSVHQHPAYPGTGFRSTKNASNYPVAPGASRAVYRGALSRAMDDIAKFEPDLVAVSGGFDAFKGDPLADEPLEAEDYHWIGDTLRKAGTPTFSILEGGYSKELPDLILAYLKGLSGK